MQVIGILCKLIPPLMGVLFLRSVRAKVIKTNERRRRPRKWINQIRAELIFLLLFFM